MVAPEDNLQGYAESPAVTHAKDLKGKPLLTHGTSDGNARISNSMQLAYAFEKAYIPFDLMVYPRQMHHIDDQDLRVHLFRSITDYVLQNL